jgi:nicotinamidase/pyrazinamidase
MNGRIVFDREHSALLIVDMQPDFMPDGALPVAGGDELLAPIGQLIDSQIFDLIVATQDWHARDHVSFAGNHPGRKAMDRIQLYGHDQTLWPHHCVQGTPGAALHPKLKWDRVSIIVRKATDSTTDSYSALRNNWNPSGDRPPTGLAGYLKNRGIEAVFICGLARDYCVKWTAEDALEEGFQVWLLWDLSRAIDPASDTYVRDDLAQRGAQIITLEDLYRSQGFRPPG